jgi:DNA-binding FadR family transcriptional regulator
VNAIFPNFGCLQEGIAVAEALRRVLEFVAAPLPGGEHVSIADCAGRNLEKAFLLDNPGKSSRTIKVAQERVALATQNDFYADFMAFLEGVVRASIRIARAKSGQVKINAITIEEHARVLHAIRDRDSEGATLAMHAHLLGARGRMNISKDL